jgi:hypothetical protein
VWVRAIAQLLQKNGQMSRIAAGQGTYASRNENRKTEQADCRGNADPDKKPETA